MGGVVSEGIEIPSHSGGSSHKGRSWKVLKLPSPCKMHSAIPMCPPKYMKVTTEIWKQLWRQGSYSSWKTWKSQNWSPGNLFLKKGTNPVEIFLNGDTETRTSTCYNKMHLLINLLFLNWNVLHIESRIHIECVRYCSKFSHLLLCREMGEK